MSGMCVVVNGLGLMCEKSEDRVRHRESMSSIGTPASRRKETPTCFTLSVNVSDNPDFVLSRGSRVLSVLFASKDKLSGQPDTWHPTLDIAMPAYIRTP